MLVHRLVASASPGKLVQNAEILIPEVCSETYDPVLLKAAQVDWDVRTGLGSHTMKTQSSGTQETWAVVLGPE